jgi:HEPN domain-containing protein
MARELLLTAKSDLKALGNMLDAERFDDRIFGFHAQQAVEKALKAWLSALGCAYPYTHDLSLLLHELEQKGAVVDEHWDLLELSSFAVRFRYEVVPEGEEPLDRESLLSAVSALIAKVELM